MISKNPKFLSFTNITNIIVIKKINILFVSLKLNCLLILSMINKKNILIELNKKDTDNKNLSKSLSAIILLLEKPLLF